MPKARKKKEPIVSRQKVASATSKTCRAVIRRFHVLTKQKARLEKSAAALPEEVAAIEDQIKDLGGLELYQHMSSLGQRNDRGGGSEKVLLGWLKDMGEQKRGSGRKLRLLEVGALRPDNYHPCASWITCMPIDLHSRHPDILEQDFLLLDRNENQGKWDVISLSLVVNFVPEARDRGRMLRLSNTFLSPQGYLFLVLPLPCVTNSRYLDVERLKALMAALGFRQINERLKEGRKTAYWLYQKEDMMTDNIGYFQKRVVVRQGNRNNFCILL